MDINIIPPESDPMIDRVYVVGMTIKSFKGRKDVDVHLFRTEWDDEEYEVYEWNDLLGAPVDPDHANPEGSKKIILESFTEEERDQVIAYLKEHYSEKLSTINSAVMDLPVPKGLPSLSDFEPGKDVGLIMFDKIPHYNLPFSMRGLYDLSQHKPLVEVTSEG